MSYQISNYSPRHHLFSSSLSHIFRRDSVTKGLWIFIWIAQINCLNLHVKRKMSIQETAGGIKHRLAFIKRYTWFGVMGTVSPPLFLFWMPRLKGEMKRGLMQMLNLKRSRGQMVSGCYLNISGPVLKRFKDALWLLCVYPVQRPIPQKPRRNNYSSSPAWNSLGPRVCSTRFLCYKVNWPEGNRLKLFSFPFVCWWPVAYSGKNTQI